MLLDAEVAALAAGEPSGDVLAHRQMVRASSEALRTIVDLAAHRDDGPRLVHRPVAVSAEEYPQLSIGDFMVSLYNGLAVERLLVTWPDGRTEEALQVLDDALKQLEALQAAAQRSTE